MRHSPMMPFLHDNGCVHDATMDLSHEGNGWSSMFYIGWRRPHHSYWERMIRKFARALHATHKYLQAMGAKVAPSTSYSFASYKKALRWLDRTWWEHINANNDLVKDFRYLGARLAMTNVATRPTIDKEWDKAATQEARILPSDSGSKGENHPGQGIRSSFLRN